MDFHCLPRLRVFLDASLLALLVFTAFVLHRRAAEPKELPWKLDVNAPSNYVKPTFRRRVAVVMLGLIAWGVLGLVLTLEDNCPSSNWLVVLSLSLSGGCLVVAMWLGVREALLTINYDIFTMLQCLRCSCFSRLTKRALLLPPLTLLVTLNGVSWFENRSIDRCNASELLSPESFFAGASCIFLIMLVVTLLAVCCPLVSRRWRTAPSRLGKVLAAVGLATFGSAAICWAVVGLVSLQHQKGADPVTVSSPKCWEDLEVIPSVQWSIAELLVVGTLLLLTTLCCRLENFFLAPHAPGIDMAQLSPRLAAIKSPVVEINDAKFSEGRDATVLV
ncbi:hypothetical protein P3T76_004629 [Phytophthora citrophthora]|uniref:Transmembrane protein n=1 Tax=Phytophthora citrophthora TaxID=4793 RepID=A0AAD9GS50_9STRA|nr:hypothetical protein P3T76_004629 [Phytophthora citrophthora]